MKQMGMETKSFSSSLGSLMSATVRVDDAIEKSSMSDERKAILRGNLRHQYDFKRYEMASGDATVQALKMSHGGYSNLATRDDRNAFGGKSGTLMNLIDQGADLQAQYETQRRKVKAQLGDNPEYAKKKDEALDALDAKQNRELANSITQAYGLKEDYGVKMSDPQSLYKQIQESLMQDPSLELQMEERDLMREIRDILLDGKVTAEERASLGAKGQQRLDSLKKDEAEDLLDGVPIGGGVGPGLNAAGVAGAEMRNDASNWMEAGIGFAGRLVGGLINPNAAMAGNAPVNVVQGGAEGFNAQQSKELRLISESSNRSAELLYDMIENGLNVRIIGGGGMA
jgi:hypothetical protein